MAACATSLRPLSINIPASSAEFPARIENVFIEMIYIFFVAEETRDMMVLVLLSVLIVFLAT